MNTHTSSRRPRRASDTTTGLPLHAEDAFVVQFRSGGASDRRHLEGRVEHVVSGEVARFESAAELIAFMLRRLAAAQVSAPAPHSRPLQCP